MTDQHPITPPPELVKQWLGEFFGCTVGGELSDSEKYLATQAARWGADQQLEQDAKWLDTNALYTQELTVSPPGDALRQFMRPKPPSLKEQGLKALDELEGFKGSLEEVDIIRRALEQLPND